MQIWIRRLSKALVLSTIFLIFAGGMVTSTGSGLAVPDWPLSYGTLFPPMVGGVFYEHGHRMIASFVGFLMLILTVAIFIYEKRKWVKILGLCALIAVILQGLLGGLTVLFFLPTPISVFHAVLAQTFLVLTIIIAYTLSVERSKRETIRLSTNSQIVKLNLGLIFLIYLQLIVGAIMRHTHSGLAIPDFPEMGGMLLPNFSNEMLFKINSMRFMMNLDSVNLEQIYIHFLHRVLALVISIYSIFFIIKGIKTYKSHPFIKRMFYILAFGVILQASLGAMTVILEKHPHVTSVHVVTGAALLGFSVFLLLRIAPITWKEFKANAI